jgi:hypothetical protein
LPDPARLLVGSGKHMRHAKLKPGQSVDTLALQALVKASYQDVLARIEKAARRGPAPSGPRPATGPHGCRGNSPPGP